MRMSSLFFERFPKYLLQAHDWIPQSSKQTEWPATNLTGIDLLYIFGLGDGSAYTRFLPWLRVNPKRRLVFFEDDPGVLAALLEGGTKLFDDPQVDFELLQPDTIDRFSAKYPVSKVEVLAPPRFQKQKLKLLRKTALTSALFTDRVQGAKLYDHFVQNVPRLDGAFYANGLNNIFPGMTAIVCGAGPSLEQAIPILRDLERRAVIIAGGSAVAALSSRGIDPHFGVAIDPNEEEFHRFRHSAFFEGPLLISTRVCPKIFGTCNGPFGYLRSGTGGPAELWLDEKLGLTDPLVPEHMPEESMSVMTLALGFAEHIGCTAIVLCGMDLAYTGSKRYAPGVCSTEENGSVRNHNAADRIVRRKGKQGKFLDTAIRWIMEGASLAEFAKRRPHMRWINATEGGLKVNGFEDLGLGSVAWPEPTDIRGKITQEIMQNPMPKIPENLVPEMEESLRRVIGHLEILTGAKAGSKALAECDLQEEIAATVLFYDMPAFLARSELLGTSKSGWELYLEMAKLY